MVGLYLYAISLISWLDPVMESVYLHEWGVIEVDESCLDLRGLPDGIVYDFDYQPDVEVKAPVIWFHGFGCTGTLTVEIHNGSFSALVPRPSTITNDAAPGLPGSDVQTAMWKNLTTSSVPVDTTLEGSALPLVRHISDPQNFQAAIPLWRAVPCNSVYFPSSDYSDAFIYYESDLDNPEMFRGEYYNHEGEALLFSFPDWEFTCVTVDVPSMGTDAIPLSDQEIQSVINGWCPGLLPEEVSALWNTWKFTIEYRCKFEGEKLLLFPLSEEETESISCIHFEPYDGFISVDYIRLFLGLGAI